MNKMEFKQVVEQRYATKKFDGKKIDQKKVDELLELIRMSASSFGIQPYKIKVVSDDKTKKLLQAASWNQENVGTASHVLIFCANTDVLGNIKLLEKAMIKNGATKEGLKGYIDMMTGFVNNLNDEAKKVWTQKQAYIALGNAINGAKALGFDSCPMEGFSPAEYSKILKLPTTLIPTVVCPIGYAADKPKPKARLDKKDLFF
jgi:nitroreductase